MKVIKLSQNKETFVDDEDYKYLSQWKWYYHQGYAIRKISIGNGKRKTIRMHNEIIAPLQGYFVDHINGDTLNNLKINLRFADKSENNRNRTKRIKLTSKYKGVLWHKRDKKWQASIKVNKKQYHLGYFQSEDAAAYAYNIAAITHFGEFARINDVEPVKTGMLFIFDKAMKEIARKLEEDLKNKISLDF